MTGRPVPREPAGEVPSSGVRGSEVVCVGDELLSGRVADLNAAWLGARLAERGWPVRRVVMVADDVAVIAQAIREAAARARLVVVTGGLGGTSDDVTRQALAAVAGVGVHTDAELVAAITARYAAVGSTPSTGGLAMAQVVDGVEVLLNPAGTAPGQRLAVGNATVVLLPGVPSEMVAIAEAAVLPALASGTVLTRSLHLPLADESRVGDALSGLERELPAAVRIGYLAGAGSVEVRLTAAAADQQAARSVLEPLVERARRELSALGLVLDRPLPEALVAALRERGQTLAVAESLTGGLVAATVVEVPGASAVLRGGVVSYATDVKASALGVPAELLAAQGAVDPEVALAMARGVRDRLGADWGLSTTGVAGPDPQDGHPVGEVHVGLAGPAAGPGRQVGEVRSLALRGSRVRIRQQASLSALRLALEHVL